MYTSLRTTRRSTFAVTGIGALALIGFGGCQLFFPPAIVPQGLIITTLAGTGVAGLGDDGQPATETLLYLPQDMTVSPDNLLYIVDWNNHRIRRINADGIVETVAGTGELGPADDGPAIYQQFNHPTNVNFDAQGRMLIAAWHNSKVKRLNFGTGEVENIAGDGSRAFGGDGGNANTAKLDLPSAVCVDSFGEIIISDQANYRIRVVDSNGNIRTICGDGTPGYFGDGGPAPAARLNSPKGQAAAPAGRIDIDPNDHILIADTGNHAIRLLARDETGTYSITTVAGNGTAGYSGDGGPATAAQLNTPSDVAWGPNGEFYIADTNNNVVRVVLPDGTIHTFAGTGEQGYDGDGGDPGLAKLNRPYGVYAAVDGDVYIADTHNHRIRVVSTHRTQGAPPPQTEVEIIPCTDAPGSICTFAGTGAEAHNGDGKDRLHTDLYWPFDMEFTPSGRTYVLDWNNHQVREILADGTFKTVVGGDFVGDGPADLSDLTAPGAPGTTVQLNHPTDLFELPNGNLVIVAWHNHKLRMYDPSTGLVTVIMGRQAAFEGDGGPAKNGRLNQNVRAALDPSGNLLIVDQRNQRIRIIRDFVNQLGDGILGTVLGVGPPPGFNGDGEALATKINMPTGGNPEPASGIAIDSNGVVYFSDTNNHLIRRVDFNADYSSGQVTTIAGIAGQAGYSGDGGPAAAAQINYPQDIELGPDGKLYFCDTNNNRIRVIDLTTGIMNTVAGNGQKAYSGDGGPAVEAALNRPFGIAFGPDGKLYISDTFNSRIRVVTLP